MDYDFFPFFRIQAASYIKVKKRPRAKFNDSLKFVKDNTLTI